MGLLDDRSSSAPEQKNPAGPQNQNAQQTSSSSSSQLGGPGFRLRGTPEDDRAIFQPSRGSFGARLNNPGGPRGEQPVAPPQDLAAARPAGAPLQIRRDSDYYNLFGNRGAGAASGDQQQSPRHDRVDGLNQDILADTAVELDDDYSPPRGAEEDHCAPDMRAELDRMSSSEDHCGGDLMMALVTDCE